MASLLCLDFRRVLVFSLLLFLFLSSILFASSESDFELKRTPTVFGMRRVLEKINMGEDDKTVKLKNSSARNQTKLGKPILFSKNQTKVVSPAGGKLVSPSKPELRKLNSTKPSSLKEKKASDLMKLSSSTKNKTSTKKEPPFSDKKQQLKAEKKETNKNQKPKQTKPFWLEDDDDDLMSEFRDLPKKFHRSLLPDLQSISTTSKIYLTKANKEMTRGFKPYVGNKYAPTIASVVSCAFIILPLLLVSLVINRFKAYFSLQKVLIFIQVYLSIYFTILCLSSVFTGLEPLKFFYATSRPTYVWLQVLQTLGYVIYLLLLLMYLVFVYSTDTGMGLKLLCSAQTVVGFSIGLHYYVAVFHRVVTHQPPRTNWKVHAIYATCFFLICLFSGAERKKKAYLKDDGEEGKEN